MIEFKGTKGKWEVVKDDFFNSTVVKHKAFSVCVVNNLASNDICQANALLISKAPEMLQMLQRIDRKMCVTFDDLIEIKKIIKEATEL